MVNEELIVIESVQEIKDLITYLEPFDFIAYDTETTGLQKDTEIIGLSVCAEINKAFYIPLSWWIPQESRLQYSDPQIKEETIKLLKFLQTKSLIMHNAIFDVEKTDINFKVNLLEPLHTDTMILGHLLNENRRNGLKDLAASIFGEDEKKEQEEMKASVIANGGIWSESKKDPIKEFFKADKYILARYGAKDTILTLKLFLHMVPILFEENLDKFFYEDESMPQLKTVTYELNTVGLKLDMDRLNNLKAELEKEIILLEADIRKEITPYVLEKYPGTKPKNTFSVTAPQQLSWLMFIRLEETFDKLTDGGRKVAKGLIGRIPYSLGDKKRFIQACKDANLNPAKFLKCDKVLLEQYEDKYDWVKKLLDLRKAEKLLSTYVEGIKSRAHYGCIYPSFKQIGTKGTRMSSSNPNFQNLPRDDKRVKSCVIARPGCKLVGADYEQLEPRIFASLSQDAILLAGFKNKEDPYSLIAMEIFNIIGYSANKNDPNYFGKHYPILRLVGKEAFLSIAYGNTPYRFKETIKNKTKVVMPVEECESIITNYFIKLVGVSDFVKKSHERAVTTGKVYNLFGRPKNIPDALFLKRLDWRNPLQLEYEYRKPLNLAVNSQIQNTAGSVINRCSIAFCNKIKSLNLDARIVMQVHDELIVEVVEHQAKQVADILKDCMENTVKLPGVDLIADPKIGDRVSDLK